MDHFSAARINRFFPVGLFLFIQFVYSSHFRPDYNICHFYHFASLIHLLIGFEVNRNELTAVLATLFVNMAKQGCKMVQEK